MNQNNDNSNPKANAPTLVGKAGYIGTGILVGLIIYPFVRKAITKIQPKLDEILDDFTGKAESFAEKTSDLLARAKENLKKHDFEKDEHGNHAGHAHEKTSDKTQ